MKLHKSILFLMGLLFSFSVHAFTPDKIIIFGDSLTDNGNIYNFMYNARKILPIIPLMPKSPPYYLGRFSNGPVWSDLLPAMLNVPFNNYAFGGGWAEPFIDSKLIFPYGLSDQVTKYITSALTDLHKDNHLYIIWMGGNDYLSGRKNPDYATSKTVRSIKNQVERLLSFGAKNIVVINLPNLGITPWSTKHGSDFAQAAAKLSFMHNEKLQKMIVDLQKKHAQSNLILFDLMPILNDILAQPEKYHLTNVSDACFDGGYTLYANRDTLAAEQLHLDLIHNPVLNIAYTNGLAVKAACATPDTYFFWDLVHPTGYVHHIIADKAVEFIKNHA